MASRLSKRLIGKQRKDILSVTPVGIGRYKPNIMTESLLGGTAQKTERSITSIVEIDENGLRSRDAMNPEERQLLYESCSQCATLEERTNNQDDEIADLKKAQKATGEEIETLKENVNFNMKVKRAAWVVVGFALSAFFWVAINHLWH